MTLAVALLVLLAGGIFWYWQALPKQHSARKSATAQRSAATPKKAAAARVATQVVAASTDYRAVSIQCKSEACDAAKALGAKRFLLAEAPSLPLPGCACAHCQCSYAHHADQRSDTDDRRGVQGLQTELYTRTAKEDRRRKKRGRRKTDI
jgi:hypothetical protein